MDLTVSVNSHTPLVDYAVNLSSVTKEDALDSLKNLAQSESEDWFRIGMVLSSYRKSKGEEEFKGLLSYAEQNLQINGRKAYYLISIHDNLVASNISSSQVSSVGWTKLKEIAHLMNPDNVEYWVDICTNNTTKQLLALLKSNASLCPTKSQSIDDALEFTPVVTLENALDNASDNYTIEVVNDSGDSVFVSPTVNNYTPSDDYGNSPEVNETTGDIPVSYNDAPKHQVEALEESPPEATVIATIPTVNIANEETPIMSVLDLANILKEYDPLIVVKMVSDIYPHIKIIVTDKHSSPMCD